MQELPDLRPSTAQFLKVLKKFDGRQVNLKQFSMMLGKNRRWLRRMLKELKDKGYVKIVPENGKVKPGGACRYIFLDGFISEEKQELAEEVAIGNSVLKELGLK